MLILQIFAIVVALGLTAVTVVLTAQAVRAMLAVVRSGQPSLSRSENPVGRSVTMFKETFGHTRMFQWRWVGIMHWFVYLAFIFLSSAVAMAYGQLFDPEFVWPFIGHWFVYEWVGEGLGLLSTIGIVYLIVYRQKHHPRTEGRNSRFFGSTMWQAYFVEVMALLEGILILFIRGAEYNLGQLIGEDADRYTRFHFPIAGFFGDVLYPSNNETALKAIIIVIGLVKIVLAMVWLVVIARNLTMGIAWHRFTAWFNIWFKREPSGRTALGAVKPLTSAGEVVSLDDIEDLDEDAKLGVGAVEDFSWKNILDFTTCTECGRCQSQCPAWNTEKPLNPKLLITALRDATYAKAPYLTAPESEREALLEGDTALKTEVERPLVGDTGDEWFYMPDDGSAVIDPDVLWNCTSCGACVQQCPVDIEHVDHIIDMRRYAVLVESNFPAELNGLFKGLENKGNPWNMSSTARLDWAKGLDFEVKVVGEDIESLDEVDWLFWVGCAGAYEDRAKKTTRAVAELLDLAGVSFGVLGNGETCTGDPARRAGNEFVFQGLAQQNAETLTEHKAKKVVSTCAHCFNTLKNEYQQFGVELEVVHHTQLLNQLVRDGKLTPVADGAGAHKRSITYHDPCYIGRHNGVYTPPRELLQILPGAEVVEMERNSERSFCCGAGGARMWMEENIGERININRTVEAVGTGADQIAVGCPFCRVMLSDGLTMQQSKGEAREEVEVLDVAQMLLASVKGEVATKVKPGEGAAPAAKKSTPKATEKDETPAQDDVATKAEPEAGDETITDDTVTATEDAGPLAKASGGSSLFDDAADTSGETADDEKKPADEAKAAKPASSGGSLFDVGGDDESEPEAEPAEPQAEPAQAQPKAQDTDLGSGGSLFDVGGDDEPADEKAEAEPAKPQAEPVEGVNDEATTSEPASDVDLGAGGSLFDLEAPTESKTPKAAPAAKAEPEAEPAPEPDVEPKPEPEPAAEKSEPEATTPEPQASPASGATSQPASDVDLSSGGSLFDIEAPEPAAAAPKADPVESSDTSASDAEPDGTATAEAEQTTEAEVVESSDAPESGDTDVEPVSETETSTDASTASPSTSRPSTSGSSTSRSGTLFDVASPGGSTATTSTAAPAPEPQEPEPEAPVATRSGSGSLFDVASPSRARSTPKPPEEAPTEPAEAKEEPAPTSGLSGGPSVSAAATAAASTDAPDESTGTTGEAEATEEETAEPDADEAAHDEADAEIEATEEASPEPEPEPEPEPTAEEKPKPPRSGEAHQPRTDVEIGESSLFDL